MTAEPELYPTTPGGQGWKPCRAGRPLDRAQQAVEEAVLAR